MIIHSQIRKKGDVQPYKEYAELYETAYNGIYNLYLFMQKHKDEFTLEDLQLPNITLDTYNLINLAKGTDSAIRKIERQKVKEWEKNNK
jgi:hypothetical protein